MVRETCAAAVRFLAAPDRPHILKDPTSRAFKRHVMSASGTGTDGEGGPVVLSINVAVLLAVIIVVRLRRRTEARSRNDEKLTVVIVLVFGVLIAPTAFGQTVFDVVGQLAQGVTQSGSP
jgi:hypothetical protein